MKLKIPKTGVINKSVSAWRGLYQLPMLADRFMKGEFMSKGELKVVDQLASEYRMRLMDLSWFMKCLNEYIAHMANKEDNCTGHFYNLHPCKFRYAPP